MSGVAADRRKPRLHPRVADARHQLRQALEQFGPPAATAGSAEPQLLLVACSGGPDSLALAVAAEFFKRPARNGVRPYRVGAVVVDHGLQEGSAEVAEGARLQLESLGLAPVQVRRVAVEAAGMGPEAAARTARYAALDAAAAELGAAAVLLGHTLDDQAEQVLLGLGRGSGTRSLAGMPVKRGRYLRPFLSLRREDTEEVCEVAGLQPWHDPSNSDPQYMRSRIRMRVMPFLEDEMGPGVAQALWRSAQILAADADYLQAQAAEEYRRLRVATPDGLELPREGMEQLPAAMKHRVIALAAAELGGENPSYERLLAAESLLRRQGSAGPVQLAGFVSVYRRTAANAVHQDGTGYGNLVLRTTGRSPGQTDR
jgi:tRNA(Ile)-lysidine synthase